MSLQVRREFSSNLQMSHPLSITFFYSGGLPTFIAFVLLIAILSFALRIRTDSYGQHISMLRVQRTLRTVRLVIFFPESLCTAISKIVISENRFSYQPRTRRNKEIPEHIMWRIFCQMCIPIVACGRGVRVGLALYRLLQFQQDHAFCR